MPAGFFTFTLDLVKIMDTRSLHEDTDFATFTLLVRKANGSETTQNLTKSMGDVNSGSHKIDLTFSQIPIDATDTIVLNYLIVNSGHHNPSEVESKLEEAGTTLAVKGGTALGAAFGTSVLPGLGTILGLVAGWLAGELVGLLNADCDGPVAAEQTTMSFADANAKTATGTFNQITQNPGIDSPHGCGGNSNYEVHWFMQSHG